MDERIVRVSINVNGRTKIYEDLAIVASGTKYANALQNEAEITLTNLDRATRDYIVTQTSPFRGFRRPVVVTLEAGRRSIGTGRIFAGNVVNADVTQPPDIGVKLKCLTGNFVKGSLITRSLPGTANLSQVLEGVAQDAGNLTLNNQASDRSLSNYAFSGSVLKEIDHVQSVGGINVYIDDDTLVAKNAGISLTGAVRILDETTGMIGVPQFTERGVKVKFFVDTRTKLGGSLRITSKVNPSVNGEWVIYQLAFNIANREQPFYYEATCARTFLYVK